MFKTLANAWKVTELKNKILFTIMIILLYRIGAAITVPFVNASSVANALQGNSLQNVLMGTNNSVLNFLNTLSGGALANASLFALGVSPYITASIVIQLLTVAIPALERLAKQGDEGKKKIDAITRYVTVGISLITAIGYYFYIRYQAVGLAEGCDKWYFAVVIIACYCAGSSLVMWLAEKINESGIGNGVSIILFANIVARFTSVVSNIVAIYRVTSDMDTSIFVVSLIVVPLSLVGMLALIWFIIFFTDSERRIPVQYAKKVVGRKMYGGRNTNLPIKLNMTGVMPIIFANSILTLPGMVFGFIETEADTFWGKVDAFFSNTSSWFFVLMTFVLILAFAYFYVAISFNPVEVAGNLQQNGGSIPGIRPGKPTSTFIKRVLSKITFIGALCLSVIAVLPPLFQLILSLLSQWTGNVGFAYSVISDFVYGGTSIIIVVGVVLETIRELEAQMTMRHYKGFLD
ncbi:MAG: preprotein translocase subunit SecY [Bacteroidaceae bacterium]|nr:preprotein translocase subunit SecY [Clostridia bacterium]MBO5016011.1 preprotein translocase subunit SecY [Bacteroidaceae bacterium]